MKKFNRLVEEAYTGMYQSLNEDTWDYAGIGNDGSWLKGSVKAKNEDEAKTKILKKQDIFLSKLISREQSAQSEIDAEAAKEAEEIKIKKMIDTLKAHLN